jgi:hypothetical protein
LLGRLPSNDESKTIDYLLSDSQIRLIKKNTFPWESLFFDFGSVFQIVKSLQSYSIKNGLVVLKKLSAEEANCNVSMIAAKIASDNKCSKRIMVFNYVISRETQKEIENLYVNDGSFLYVSVCSSISDYSDLSGETGSNNNEYSVCFQIHEVL